jgi:methylmalonyl-CoA/ethylmalonyl-CoA epimerase
MPILRVDHTAIAVRDLDEALSRYEGLLNCGPSHRDRVPDQKVDVAFVSLNDTQLELISPSDPDTGVARFLERHGEGLHHIGLLVDDIRAEIARLVSRGTEMIDAEPRQGAHGLIAFVHPRAAGGVLIELVQRDP